MSVLLKNGLVVTATGSFIADVFVDGESIRSVGTGLTAPADETVDATGMYILPGAIDPHTHIDMPYQDTRSSDDWVTGSIAAACGGTTTIIDFSLQGKGESIHDAVERQKERASGRSVVDFGVHAGLTDIRPDVLSEVQRAIHDYGTPSFKIYLFYDFRVSDADMMSLLVETRKHDGLLEVHAEDWDIIQREGERLSRTPSGAPLMHARAHSVAAEVEAIKRVVQAVQLTDSRMYVVHLSSADGLAEVRAAQMRGLRLRAETCPQYLTLTEERYEEPHWAGAKYVMSPPLRTSVNLEPLWRGIREGAIQTIGTDHCPFNFDGQKDMNGRDDWRVIPNGAPGIETMLMLLHSEGVVKGRISREKMVDVLSTTTARTFGLPHKGAIAPGMDADIIVFDPLRRFTIRQRLLHQHVDYTPWEGWEIIGMPRIVYSRGTRIAEWAGDRMRFIGAPGAGRFLRRSPIGAL